MKIKDVVIKEANIVPYQPNLPAVPNTAPSTLVNNPNVIDVKAREIPDKIQKATRAARPAAGAALVPAAVAAGGATLSNVAANQVAAMTPQQRQQFYDDPMIGAMSGDAGFAAAIMNQAEKTPQQAAPADQGARPTGKWPTTDAEIKAFQTANKLKPDGKIGKNTLAALQKAGATPPPGFKPVGTKTATSKKSAAPNTVPQDTLPTDAQNATSSYAPTISDRAKDPNVAGVTATDPSIDPYDPSKDPSLAAGNAALAQPAPAQNPDLDRLKQLAIGQNTLNQQASQQGKAMAQATQSTSPPPNTNALGVAQTANVANALQPAPQADKPAGQAARPNLPPGLSSATTSQGSSEPSGQTAQANPDGTGIGANAQVNPDTGASTVAPTVKTGTGGTLTTSDGKAVTSRSEDEIAWANANPQNRFNPNGYPGPGKWDPKTGRTKTDPNAPGFFDKLFGKKTAAQPQKESAELARLRQLSGLK